MPGYKPTEGLNYFQSMSDRNVDAGNQIRSLEERLRAMQWSGAPPYQMQEIEAQIEQLKQRQAMEHANKLYKVQKEGMRPVSSGIGGAVNPAAGQRRTDAALLTNYLNQLFGISAGGGIGGGNPNREY